jgi:hypothetical protein
MRMLHGWLSLLTVALVSVAPVLQAQVNLEAQDPEGAFLAFFRAFAQQRWEDAVALLDVADLDQYRRQLVTSARLQPPVPQLTVEDLLRQDPDMPRAVAEYQLERMKRERASSGSYLSFEFAGVRDPAQLDSLPIADLAARWLRAQHPTTRLKDQLLQKGCRIPPDLDSQVDSPSVAIVGSAEQQDGTAFVLFADTSLTRHDSGFHGASPQIAHLKRTPSGWRVVARYDLIHPVNTFLHLATCPEQLPRK